MSHMIAYGRQEGIEVFSRFFRAETNDIGLQDYMLMEADTAREVARIQGECDIYNRLRLS
jgi:hypothetical protein